MQGERRRRTRREVLIGGAALGAAAALGVATAGSPFAGGTQTVTFWHLFGGGDGERLTGILAAIDAEHDDTGRCTRSRWRSRSSARCRC